jgi:hypothetical protein
MSWFLHSHEALRAMIPNRSGSIVNVGSYACYYTFPQIAAYAASKAAIPQLTRTTALRISPTALSISLQNLRVQAPDTYHVLNVRALSGSFQEHPFRPPLCYLGLLPRFPSTYKICSIFSAHINIGIQAKNTR